MAPKFLSRLKISFKDRGSKTSAESQTKENGTPNISAAVPSTSSIALPIELLPPVQSKSACSPQQAISIASPAPPTTTFSQSALPKQPETKAVSFLWERADDAFRTGNARLMKKYEKPLVRESAKKTSNSNISNSEPLDMDEQDLEANKRIYEMLDNGQFRVFRLLPGDFDDPIEGSLEVVSLDNRPEYVAISYVWGNDSASESFLIDRKELVPTRNLEAALRHLRSTTNPNVLWIDAICINQADAQERAEQVKLMGRIYELSGTVLIWLGPGNKETDEVIHEISAGYEGDWDSYQFQKEFLEVICRPWFTRIWVVQEFILCKWQPLVVCGHERVWWSKFQRAWILFEECVHHFYSARLEAVLGALRKTFEPDWIMTRTESSEILGHATEKEIVLKLADLGDVRKSFLVQLGFGDMSGLLQDIRDHPRLWSERLEIIGYHINESPEAIALQKRLNLFNRNFIGYAKSLQNSRDNWLKTGDRMTIGQILPKTMHLRCTDPRDKIYSILGLVHEDTARQFPVDYTAAYEQVFILSMAHMVRERLVDPSLQAWLWRKREENSSLPSWVPNFAASCEWLGPYATHTLLEGCGNAGWDWDHDVHVSADNMSLSSQGFSLGVIKELIHCTGDGREAVLDHLADIDALSKRESSMKEPLWFTLLDGHHKATINRRRSIGRFSYIEKEDYGQEYLNLLEFVRGDFHAELLDREELLLKRMAIMICGRKFFVTDTGFAGVATPDVAVGDIVAVIPCMIWTPILRSVKREEREMLVGLPHDSNCHYKIVGFAYFGCKDRAVIDPEQAREDWRQHHCFKGKDATTFIIV